MLAVDYKPFSAGTSGSRLLPLESWEFIYGYAPPSLRLPVAPRLASDAAKFRAALPGREPPETSVKKAD